MGPGVVADPPGTTRCEVESGIGVWRSVRSLWRRLEFLFKHNYWKVVLLVGLLSEAVAAAFWKSSPFVSGTFAGIGGSVLATFVVNLVGPASEEVYQRFLQLGVIGLLPQSKSRPSGTMGRVAWGDETQVRSAGHCEWRMV